MARVTVVHVRHAWDIRLPGESCMSHPGQVPDGWLELDCVYRDSRGNKRWRSVYGPASRRAMAEACRKRIAWAERLSRPEKISVILDYLGDYATYEDAENVLDALEARGYAVVRDMMGVQIIPPIREDEFWGIVDEVCRADDNLRENRRRCDMLDYEPSVLRELYHRLYPETTWDGRCVVCGHDFFNYCQGNCTCLSCNALRQDIERDRSER